MSITVKNRLAQSGANGDNVLELAGVALT